MYNLIKNKKGVHPVIVILISLLSVVVLFLVIKNTAPAFAEESVIQLCRNSNALKATIDDATPVFNPGQRVCSTILKTSGSEQIPSSRYTQKISDEDEAATAEIADMMKNCWFMWLEGEQPETFKNFWSSNGCFVCYEFKVKNSVKLKDLVDTLNRPVEVTADKVCSPAGGYLINIKGPETCKRGEKAIKTLDTPPGQLCCIRDIRNECENLGGECSDESISGKFLYSKWSCPKGESCYVPSKMISKSFEEYIKKDPPGGNILYVKNKKVSKLDTSITDTLIPKKSYAISYVSPQKCSSFDPDAEECNKIGFFKWAPILGSGQDLLFDLHILTRTWRNLIVVSELAEVDEGLLNCQYNP